MLNAMPLPTHFVSIGLLKGPVAPEPGHPQSAQRWARENGPPANRLARHDRPDLQIENGIAFQYITSRSEFERLEGDWNDLFDRTSAGRHIFQSFNWLWHWLNHYGDDQRCPVELALVAGYRQDKLVLVWPMVIKRGLGLKRLMFMGAPVSQYGDALIDPSAVSTNELMTSWAFLTRNANADVLHLRKVRADAAVAPVLASLALKPIETNSAPCLDLASAPTFDAYQQRYASKARKNRRRLRRRLGELGEVVVTPQHDLERRGPLVEKAVHLKRKWLQARALISPAVQDDRMVDFFRDAATSTSHPTGCRLASIEVGDDTAAIEISFRAHNHLAVHLIVYDLAYEKCGAGALLMEDSIRDALGSGVETFDLMAPGDDYKMDWADKAIDVDDWMLGLSGKGRFFQRLQVSKAMVRAKDGLQKLPVAFRRHLAKALSLVLCVH
jgi:CelD/BcsL family acetyltransferase involved in cellulose biosynthesis